MTVTIAFLAILAAIAFAWLARQRLFARPWLEQGILDEGTATPRPDMTPKVGLGLLLAVIGSLFALFIGAYVIRADSLDWRPVPVPPVIWFNTALLVLASICLEWALDASRRDRSPIARRALLLATAFGLAFLVGQLLAWQQLSESGYFVAGNPSNSFFYLLTGLHGLHIIGGLVALLVVTRRAYASVASGKLALNVELCATYWLFLLFVWVALLALLSGGAAQFIDLCRQLFT